VSLSLSLGCRCSLAAIWVSLLSVQRVLGLLWNIEDRSRGGCADRARGGWGWGWGWVGSVLMSLLIVGVRKKKKI
jgi:hypothetical protein